MKKLLSLFLSVVFLASPAFANFFSGTSDLHPGHRSSVYYIAGALDNTSDTLAVTADTLYAIPMRVKTGTTFTELGVEVTTGAAGNGKLCVYSNSNGYPGTRLYDGGSSSFTTSGTGTKTVNPALTVRDDIVFLAVVFDATPTARSRLAGNAYFEFGTASTSGGGMLYYAASSTYATGCPASYPAGATLTRAEFPTIWLRL